MNKLIKSVLDKYFLFQEERDANHTINKCIPESMKIDLNNKKEWGIWKAIESTINEKDIEDLSKYFKKPLPLSYIYFLKQYHYMELNLGEYSIGFFENLPNRLVEDTIKKIENFYWTLVDRNYLPFADLGDYGVLCFDANNHLENNDYKIVSFDHEDEYKQAEFYSNSFEEMFYEFDSHLNEKINNFKQK